MSEQQPPLQPPYGVPSGYPPGQPPLPPTKPRPSAIWFAVGGFLLVLSVVVAIGLFIWTLSGFFETDARVAADGRPHEITVGTDGDRMLWKSDDVFDSGCRVVDLATEQQIPLRAAGGSFTRSTGSGDWVGSYRFDPGSGHLIVTCKAGPFDGDQLSEVEIGPAPQIGNFVGGLVATIAIPTLIGLTGLAVLLVTGILWTTRPSRRRQMEAPRA